MKSLFISALIVFILAIPIALAEDDGVWAASADLEGGGSEIVAAADDYSFAAKPQPADHKTIAASDIHTLGLRSDGTVVATGADENGQCDVSGWKGIVSVAAGIQHTVGLRRDGTVFAVGDNDDGQCDVSGWTDIVAVAAATNQTFGLRSDGTVVATGWNGDGRCDVSGWADIVAVAAGGYHTVGLRSDGTVVASGNNEYGQCDVSGWTDIIDVVAGDYYTLGLRSDGTFVSAGDNEYGQCDLTAGKDIVAAAAGGLHTVGLCGDGTVVGVGINNFGQCNVSGWTDIVAVEAGITYTIGLRSDGTVVATGNNEDGQCNVSDWMGIMFPGDSRLSSPAGNPPDTDMESGEAEYNQAAGQQQPDDAYRNEPTPESADGLTLEENGGSATEFDTGATQAPASTPAAVNSIEEVVVLEPVEDATDGEATPPQQVGDAPAAVNSIEEVIVLQPVEDTTGGEAQLRQLLRDQAGEEAFEFFCADYDGNGTYEAFALLGGPNDWGGYSGDVWFVNANGATCIQQGLSYFKLEMLGNTPTMIFLAEEYYGGSGSTSHTWMVDGDNPREVEAQVSGDLEWAGGNDYYGYPSAFDMFDDGTGHTWKRYYFYMDNGTLREYGGINISLDELLEFDGAAELIDAKLAEGYSVGSIIYRGNGVINVNLKQGNMNGNISLRYDETSVHYWEEDGGVYLPASDPSIAVYPEGFRHPSGSGASSDVPGNQQAVKPTQGEQSGDPASGVNGYSCAFDLDGNGTQENLLLYAKHGSEGSENLQIRIYLKVSRADGSVLAEGQINEYEIWAGWDTNEGPDWRYLIYNLGDDRLFIHAQCSWEGIADDYLILHMESGKLTEEMHVSDPDMSDACGIYDELTGEEIYYSWAYDDRAGAGYMNSLNSFTAPYGLSFHAQGDHACVDLPDTQLICVATALQIDPAGPVPYENHAFAELDVAPYVDQGA